MCGSQTSPLGISFADINIIRHCRIGAWSWIAECIGRSRDEP